MIATNLLEETNILCIQVGWNCVLTRIASSESNKANTDKHRIRESRDVELGEPALKES